jgi:hypothetical protein
MASRHILESILSKHTLSSYLKGRQSDLVFVKSSDTISQVRMPCA